MKSQQTSSLLSAPIRENLRRAIAARPGAAAADVPTLINGDCTRAATLKKESADLIITSPPYNVGMAYSGDADGDSINIDSYLEFTRKWLAACYHWTRPTGRICVNVSIDKNKNGKIPLAAHITTIGMQVGWQYHATILWNEGNISRRTAWGSWKSASAPHVIAPVEVIIVMYKDRWKRERPGENDITGEEFKEWVLGMWSFNGESGKRIGHEAPFPRELPKRCMKLFSFVGDTVLDPFCGSGTTMIEAINSGRNAVGIEVEPRYCRLIIERIEKECGVRLQESSPKRAGKFIKNVWRL